MSVETSSSMTLWGVVEYHSSVHLGRAVLSPVKRCESHCVSVYEKSSMTSQQMIDVRRVKRRRPSLVALQRMG